MSIFDKIPFLRKKEQIEPLNLGLGDETAMGGALGPNDHSYGQGQQEQGYGGYQQQPFQQVPYSSPFQQRPGRMEPMQDQQAFLMSKNVEILNAKLDTLKATLDSVSQRIANIESMLWEQRRRY